MTFFSSLYLEPDQVTAIGRVAVESAYCEHAVDEITVALCSQNEETERRRAPKAPHSEKLDFLLNEWSPLLAPHEKGKLSEIVGALKEANERRNDIMHGLWSAEKSRIRHALESCASANPLTRKPPYAEHRQRKTGSLSTVSVDQVLPLAERIGELTISLWSLAQDAGLMARAS